MSVEPVLNTKALQGVCRTCLQTQELFFIQDVQLEGVWLTKVLSKWTDFQRDCETRMPQKICKPCMKWAYNIDYFLTCIQKTQKILVAACESSQYLESLQQVKQEDIQLDNHSMKDDVDKMSESSDTPCDNIDCFKEEEDSDTPCDNLECYNREEETNIDESVPADSFEQPIPPPEDNGLLKTLQEGTPEWFSNEINKEKSEIQALRKTFIESEKLAVLQKEWESHGNDAVKKEIIFQEPNENAMYFCGTCELGFGTHEMLKMHKRIALHNTGRTYYGCSYCKKKMKYHSGFIDHLNMHRKNRPNVCPTCGKAFTAKGDLSRHINRIHLKKQKLKCQFCYRLFSNQENLEEHEKTHEDTNYVCSWCGKTFKKFRSWFGHERLHKKNKHVKDKTNADECKTASGEFQCNCCGVTFKNKPCLEQHLVQHSRTKATCDICLKEFSGADRLKNHKYNVHPVRQSACHLCDFKSNYKDTLKSHIARVHQDVVSTTAGKFTCEHCDKVFYNKKSLRLHLRIHNNDTTYQCKICSKICTAQRNLDIHMRVHTGERTHECPHCGKKFAAKINLKYHIETHTGQPTYQCSLCKSAFYRNYMLSKHMRRVHSKKKSAENGKSIRDTTKNGDPNSDDLEESH